MIRMRFARMRRNGAPFVVNDFFVKGQSPFGAIGARQYAPTPSALLAFANTRLCACQKLSLLFNKRGYGKKHVIGNRVATVFLHKSAHY